MITVKNLANSQLPNAKGTLYTVPGATTAVVVSITLVNTDTNPITCNLYYKKATSRRIIPRDMTLDPGAKHTYDDILTMDAGDLVEGDASTGNKIDYVISGLERT